VWSRTALAVIALLAILCFAAAADGALAAALVLGLLGGALAVRSVGEASSAMAVTLRAVERQAPRGAET